MVRRQRRRGILSAVTLLPLQPLPAQRKQRGWRLRRCDCGELEIGGAHLIVDLMGEQQHPIKIRFRLGRRAETTLAFLQLAMEIAHAGAGHRMHVPARPGWHVVASRCVGLIVRNCGFDGDGKTDMLDEISGPGGLHTILGVPRVSRSEIRHRHRPAIEKWVIQRPNPGTGTRN